MAPKTYAVQLKARDSCTVHVRCLTMAQTYAVQLKDGGAPPVLHFRIGLSIRPLQITMLVFITYRGCPNICFTSGLIPFPYPCLEWCPELQYVFFRYSMERWDMILYEFKTKSLDSTPPDAGLLKISQEDLETLVVTWTAFEDKQTAVANYEVCLGTSEGKSDIMPWVDVGLSGNVNTPQLAVSHARDVYASVKAYNTDRVYTIVSERVRFVASAPAVSDIAMLRTMDMQFVTRTSPQPDLLKGSKCAAYDQGQGWINTCVMVTTKNVPVKLRVTAIEEAPILRVGYAYTQNVAASLDQGQLAGLIYASVGFEGSLFSDLEFDSSLPDDIAENVEYMLVIRTENRIGHVGHTLAPLPLLYYESEPSLAGLEVAVKTPTLRQELQELHYLRPGSMLLEWDGVTHPSGILRYETAYSLDSKIRPSSANFQDTEFRRQRYVFPDVSHGDKLLAKVRTTSFAGLSRVFERTVIADGKQPVCDGNPIDLAVTESLSVSRDITHAKSISIFRSQWSCSDSTSGLVKIMAGVGRFRFAYDVIDLVEFPVSDTVFDVKLPENVRLEDDTEYYVTIMVEDTVGWRTYGSSSGVIFDQTAPTCEGLFAPKDGPIRYLDRKFHGSSMVLEATWSYAFDRMSQTLRARVQAQRMERAGNDTWVYPLSGWIDMSTAKTAKIRVPRTVHGSTYRVAVSLTDLAGNEAMCYTDGVTVGALRFPLAWPLCSDLNAHFASFALVMYVFAF